MFKNATFYRTNLRELNLRVTAAAINFGFEVGAFIPCAPTQPKSTGWVPPRAEFGLLAEIVGDQLILKLMTEVRVIPTDALARAVEEQRKRIEKATGRKPGKKQTKELKEEVMLSLLPTALTRRSAMLVWIDLGTGMLMIDTPSRARADDAVTLLIAALPTGTEVMHSLTVDDPSWTMAEWLGSGEAPPRFSVDRECELKSKDGMKSVVRYGSHALDIDEVRAHIAAGKVPTKLALTWQSRISFVLTDDCQLKKLTFLDGLFAGKTNAADAFDADIAIATGELQPLLADLVDAMGGYMSARSAEAA